MKCAMRCNVKRDTASSRREFRPSEFKVKNEIQRLQRLSKNGCARHVAIKMLWLTELHHTPPLRALWLYVNDGRGWSIIRRRSVWGMQLDYIRARWGLVLCPPRQLRHETVQEARRLSQRRCWRKWRRTTGTSGEQTLELQHDKSNDDHSCYTTKTKPQCQCCCRIFFEVKQCVERFGDF